MWSYIVRRLCFGIPTLLGVTIIVFTLLHLAPGDPINAMVPPDAPVELVQMIRQQMGLDQPLPVQYWRWLTRVAHGDLGNSLATRRPVLQEIRAALGNTFLLAISAACLGFTMGVALGTTAAFFRGRWLDKVVSAMAITGVSLPHYWVGIMLIIDLLGDLELAAGDGDAGDFREFVPVDAPAAHDPAQYRLVPHSHGGAHAPGARQRAGNLAARLRADVAGQGFMGADGDVARHEECRPASADLDGLAVWLSAGWLGPRRDCV